MYALRPPAAGKRNKMSFYLQPAWATAKEFYCANTLSKRVVAPAAAPAGDDAQAPKPERQPLFLDECIPSFFRRPAWSPDGSFLVLPAGMQRIAGTSREINTAYLYARGKWAAPVAHLPAQTKPVVAVRFCPVIFRNDAAATSPPPALFEKLPYKMVFAVATLDSVLVYDTSSALPLVVFGQLHYDSITDVAWSANGQYLAVASRDCYCSIATFQAGELGEPIALEELPPHMQKRMAGKEGVPVPVKEVKGAGSSPAEQRQGQAGAVAPAAAAAQLQSPTEGVAAASAPPAAAEAVVKPVRKRIVPEMMSVPVQAAAPAVQQEAGPSVPSAKKPKRCTPTLVQLPPAAPAAAPDSGETEKAPKRITPTPVSDTEAQFDKVKSVVAARPAEPSPATAAPASHRRITPVPVASSTAPQAAKKPAFSIAALAMAAGQKAAEQGKQ